MYADLLNKNLYRIFSSIKGFNSPTIQMLCGKVGINPFKKLSIFSPAFLTSVI